MTMPVFLRTIFLLSCLWKYENKIPSPFVLFSSMLSKPLSLIRVWECFFALMTFSIRNSTNIASMMIAFHQLNSPLALSPHRRAIVPSKIATLKT